MSNLVYELGNINKYVQYFENLVTEASFLSYFAYTKENFDRDSLRPERRGWCLILEPYDSTVRDNTADSVLSYNKGFFVIAKKKTSEFRPQELEQIAQVLAQKIIGRIRRDRRLRILETNLDNWSMQTIDPMFAGEFYGVMVSFDFYHPINKFMKFEENDWNGAQGFDYNFDLILD